MNIEKKLYQWDTGQKLTGCTGLYVDFPIDNEVYRVETADGTCIIPDELLQTSGSHKVYECMTNNTIRSFAFSVTPRLKPPDYVYTPTERLTFEGLVQRVDDAVADMIRRAESGEFDGHTPVKGTDYFTTGEIQQIQNEVSSGAIGEFKSVVDTETETFNTNAESKLTTYNENDVAKTGAYNTNASDKLDDYNTNASNKVTEYNSNAENKTAEFDTHTEQIQADISELKSDLTGLQTVVDSKADKSDLAKTNLYLDALFKLNKGQTWDTIESESEAYSVDVPSGSHYASVDMVGGKSIVWNQLIDTSAPYAKGGKLSVNENIFTLTPIENTVDMWEIGFISKVFTRKSNHKYYMSVDVKSDAWATSGNAGFVTYDGLWCLNGMTRLDTSNTDWQTLKGVINSSSDATGGGSFLFRKYYEETKAPVSIRNFVCCDLTQMFGAGNEPSIEAFEAMFPADYYPYCEPTIISSQTDRVDVRGKNIFDANAQIEDFVFPLNGGTQTRKGIKITNENGTYACYSSNPKNIDLYYYLAIKHSDGTVSDAIAYFITSSTKDTKGTFTISDNDELWLYDAARGGLMKYVKDVVIQIEKGSTATEYSPYSLQKIPTNFPVLNSAGSVYDYIDLNEGKLYTWTYIEGNEVKALTEPVITDIEIPTELTDWLTVEAGGSVTFHNADEGKRLLVPNKLSFIRKLDEVTV